MLALTLERPIDLAVTEPVLMEVLAGARLATEVARLKVLLSGFSWIPCDPVADFEGAADLYRQCRSAGVTPRNMLDCMIATIAIRTDAQVLTADRDLAAMASVIPLSLVEV